MRFLVDECTGPMVARWLTTQGHDVFSVFHESRGLDDVEVIRKAYAENRILITNDKDFGEKVYRERHPHRGIVLLRLDNERPACKVNAVQRLLQGFADRLADQFVVVTETRVRFARRQPD
jgi:predicted nuclease of predicted toxin-antitoxin system